MKGQEERFMTEPLRVGEGMLEVADLSLESREVVSASLKSRGTAAGTLRRGSRQNP